MHPKSEPAAWLTSTLGAAAIACVVFAVFSPARTLGFLNFDDPVYVTSNTVIQQGLSPSTVAWTWTAIVGASWYPLTLMSHLLDVTLFGMNPAGHHLSSVALHAASAAVLFLALRSLTNRAMFSFAVTLLWAVHPLRVESVAWIAERKDVLSGLFWMLVLWAYAAYARRPHWGRYALVLVLFMAALMAKSSVVTLPIVLLLLDGWPLRRWENPGASGRSTTVRLLMEKVPLFGLAAAAAVAILVTQADAGAVTELHSGSLGTRVSTILGAYWIYLRQLVWPGGLSVFYPMPDGDVLMRRALLGGGSILLMTSLGYGLRKRAPGILVGWLWFLVVLFPMIGIVQIGAQAHADRYTYLSHIGLLIALASLIQVCAPKRLRKPAIAGVAVAVVATAAAWMTVRQLPVWRSSLALWEHALSVTEHNARAYDYHGQALMEAGEVQAAIGELQYAVALEPGNPHTRHNLAVAYTRAGRLEEAKETAALTAAAHPDHILSRMMLATWAIEAGEFGEAEERLLEVLALDAHNRDALINLGVVRANQGRYDEAEKVFRRLIELSPDSAEAYFYLGRVLEQTGVKDEAQRAYRQALRVDPEFEKARVALENLEHEADR